MKIIRIMQYKKPCFPQDFALEKWAISQMITLKISIWAMTLLAT